MGIYYGPGTVLSVLHESSHLILTTNLCDRYYYYAYLHIRKMKALKKLINMYKLYS